MNETGGRLLQRGRRGRLGVLRRLLGALLVLAQASTSVSLGAQSASPSAQSPSFASGEETPGQFPAGLGRDETFYVCTACHNFKLVAAQGMSLPQWEDTLAWMTQRHGMPPLEGVERDRVLNYLATTFPPQLPQVRGGWRNPFAPR